MIPIGRTAYDPRFVPIGMGDDDQDSAPMAGAPMDVARPNVAPIGSPEAPAVVRKPVAPIGNPQLDADEKRLGYLRRAGSGIDQITKPVDAEGNPTGQNVGLGHKILGTLARIGDVAVGTTFPGAARLIPGTSMHHQALIGGAENAVSGDLESQTKTAQANEQNARAAALLNPPDKDTNDFEKVIVAGADGQPQFANFNKKSGKYFDLAGNVLNGAKPYEKPEKAPNTTPEEQYLADFQKRNPNATLADAIRSYARDSKVPADTSGKETARSDKSFQYNSDKLDKLGAPVEQLAMRIGRLKETIAQNNPQADALVAPELLTVMAGGQGSGLRMNEAEISRIVGGRSNWENLKASINKWRTDPNAARSITPAQQQQIQSLVNAVYGKLMEKQRVLDGARDNLLNSDDPKEHRRIVNEAHKTLTSIDERTGEQEQRPANVPAGWVHKTNGPHGSGWYPPEKQ